MVHHALLHVVVCSVSSMNCRVLLLLYLFVLACWAGFSCNFDDCCFVICASVSCSSPSPRRSRSRSLSDRDWWSRVNSGLGRTPKDFVQLFFCSMFSPTPNNFPLCVCCYSLFSVFLFNTYIPIVFCASVCTHETHVLLVSTQTHAYACNSDW